VIAASEIEKSGPVISGNVEKIVTLKVDPGYGPDPGNAGTGTVLAVVCQGHPEGRRTHHRYHRH
jgi:hypothetical protein